MTEEWLRRWGTTIRLTREALGISQAELAKKVDVTKPTISRWENGKVTISDSHKLAVAEALGVDVRILFPLVRGAA